VSQLAQFFVSPPNQLLMNSVGTLSPNPRKNNCHKANKFTSGHKTVSITNISEVEKSLNFFRYACPDHKNEELKLFCVDHDVPCCSLCVSVTHRKCNEVVTVDQAANGFLTSESAQKIAFA
jgi:hypothetical protein